MESHDQKRRSSPRTPTSLSASITEIDNTLSASVLNISNGGLFIRCLKPPAEWQDVDITISLPQGKEVRARGVVVWRLTNERANPESGVFPGAGIQFLEIDDRDLELIRQHVEKK